MIKRTPQERLEIKEFILDSNLFLISSSLSAISLIAINIYFIIFVLFDEGKIDLYRYISISIVFIMLLCFMVLAYRGVATQKKYISRLDTVFEDIEIEEK